MKQNNDLINAPLNVKQLAKDFLEARRSRELSLLAASEEMGVSKSSAWRVEAGSGKIDTETLRLACNWLDKTVQYYFTPTAKKTKKNETGK